MARKARSAAPAPAPAVDPAATAPQTSVAVPEAASGPAPTAPVPATPPDEPVRVDEPQHAAAGDREGDGDPSLRQLFWGEES
jgi:hypothetical protein